MEACALNRCVYSSKSTTCCIKVPYREISMNEKLIVNALIKLASASISCKTLQTFPRKRFGLNEVI